MNLNNHVMTNNRRMSKLSKEFRIRKSILLNISDKMEEDEENEEY